MSLYLVHLHDDGQEIINLTRADVVVEPGCIDSRGRFVTGSGAFVRPAVRRTFTLIELTPSAYHVQEHT